MGITERTGAVRKFLLEAIAVRSPDVIKAACRQFGVSRQAINRHISGLVAEGLVSATGRTRNRTYQLATLSTTNFVVRLEGLEEHVLWRKKVEPLLKHLPVNVINIWQYGFNVMVNNAIDHSNGSSLHVTIETTALSTVMWILDDGIGIFLKIKEELGLDDERHAILELAKGKLTTDPKRHTGEGIFFTSRMFDEFRIISGDVHFAHEMSDDADWVMERDVSRAGTSVLMSIRNGSTATTQRVLDKYSTKGGDFVFNKTVVPVRLLRYGTELLVSRSQAKRLLARFERFSVVFLDFRGVDSVGQAFADEVFRVYASHNPAVKLIPINMTRRVRNMVKHVRGVTAGK